MFKKTTNSFCFFCYFCYQAWTNLFFFCLLLIKTLVSQMFLLISGKLVFFERNQSWINTIRKCSLCFVWFCKQKNDFFFSHFQTPQSFETFNLSYFSFFLLCFVNKKMLFSPKSRFQFVTCSWCSLGEEKKKAVFKRLKEVLLVGNLNVLWVFFNRFLVGS